MLWDIEQCSFQVHKRALLRKAKRCLLVCTKELASREIRATQHRSDCDQTRADDESIHGDDRTPHKEHGSESACDTCNA